MGTDSLVIPQLNSKLPILDIFVLKRQIKRVNQNIFFVIILQKTASIGHYMQPFAAKKYGGMLATKCRWEQ